MSEETVKTWASYFENVMVLNLFKLKKEKTQKKEEKTQESHCADAKISIVNPCREEARKEEICLNSPKTPTKEIEKEPKPILKKVTIKEDKDDSKNSKANVSSPVRSFQKVEPAFKIRNNKGELFCFLCSNLSFDSADSFLTHCQTKEHKAKLRERFQCNLSRDPAREKSAIRECAEKVCQTESKPKGIEGKSKVNKLRKKRKKKASLTVPAAKLQENFSQKNKTEKIATKKKMEETQENISENQKLLTITTSLIACIGVDSQNMMKCHLCDKFIPTTSDFELFMKNVSCHVWGQKHFKKLLAVPEQLKQILKEKSAESQIPTQPALANSQKKNINQIKIDKKIRELLKADIL